MRKRFSSVFCKKTNLLLLIILCGILCVVLYFFAGHKPAKTIPAQNSRYDTKTENGSQKTDSSKQKATATESFTERENSSEKTTENPTVNSIEIEQKVFLMEKGDQCTARAVTDPASAFSLVRWESDDPAIASVNGSGTITAKKDGNTVIRCLAGDLQENIYINVVTATPDGSMGSLTLYNENGKKISYRLYHQSAHTYGDHSAYLAWHGCAHCSLATVLGAFSSSYADITPDQIINSVEKTVTGTEAWTRHHVTKPAGTAMPLSLSGISAILSYGGVEHDYIRSFQKETAREDILSHLRTGNPVLFEVKKKSNITGKKDSKWTGSVHTMVFLGVYTNGNILVSDSVNHSWYSGGQRAKIADIDDLMEYMYSCTTFDTKPYFKSISSDGGYMKIY